MRTILRLFLSFAYIGAMTFGGGYSMLPMLRRELVDKRGWLTELEMTDAFSVSQCLPGVIAINTAVLAGFKQKGVIGGISAALGVAFPSIAIITVIAAFISSFGEIPLVQKAFSGLRVCVSVLIINTVITLWKKSIADVPAMLIFAAVFIISIFTALPVAALVLAAGAAGIAISSVRKRGTP